MGKKSYQSQTEIKITQTICKKMKLNKYIYTYIEKNCEYIALSAMCVIA